MAQDEKNLLFEQYKLYYEMKEKFVDRNFTTNKFYLSLIVAIYVVMFFTRDISFDYNISANLVMALIGMAVSFFWWSNADSYNVMIKVKLKHVIDEMEKQLPFAPHLLEMQNYANYKKQNKLIIFSDIQKGIALAMAFIFFVLFLFELAYPLITIFYGPVDATLGV